MITATTITARIRLMMIVPRFAVSHSAMMSASLYTLTGFVSFTDSEYFLKNSI
jgi:hypothetical protein